MKTNLTEVFLFVLLALTPGVLGQEFPKMSEGERIEMLKPPVSHPVRMVLDTDTYNEIDDQFAVVYSLISPELDVQALYAAPFKNSRSAGPGDGMQKSYDEILRILSRLDKSPAGFAFKGSTHYLTDPKNPEQSPAVLDLIERATQSSPQDPLYVVAVGAITNVSNAILRQPSIIGNMVVVWLGGNGHNWPHQREFNYQQDLRASRVIFDSGVPLVQLPCTPIVTHFTTTVPEMERYVAGRGAIGDYLLTIFKQYRQDHFAWSKVLWDMTAVAWVINANHLPSDLVHSPIVTDNYTFSFDRSRHLIRVVNFVHRDPIFRDFFTKLRAGQQSSQPPCVAAASAVTKEPDVDIRYVVMSISLAVSVLMLVGKLTAYFITGSAAILADASESVVHLAATGFAAYSLWYSLQPADDCHPYGHGRISFFSAGFEGALVFVASFAVIGSGVFELWRGPDVESIGVGLTITIVLAFINLALGVTLVVVGRQNSSLVLVANGKHVLTDVYTTAAAIVGLVLVLLTGRDILDPLAAIAIGFLIMAGGFSLLRSAIAGLMDRMPAELGRQLDEAVATCRDADSIIEDVHEMRARLINDEIWLEMHVLVDGSIPVTQAHEAVTRFEKELDRSMSTHRLRISSHIEPIEHGRAHPEGHEA